MMIMRQTRVDLSSLFSLNPKYFQNCLYFSTQANNTSKTFKIKQGIEVLSQYTTVDRYKTYEKILSNRCSNIRIVFESVSNPDNVWASLRSMDCFGLQYADIIPSRLEA